MRVSRLSGVIGCLFAGLAPAAAQDVRITEALPEITFSQGGKPLTIRRNPDPDARIPSDFSRTSRACPPFCIQPATVAPGVETLAELELMLFLKRQASDGTGLLVDARLPEFFARGTIPGAVNLPFTTLEPGNPYLSDLLRALDARPAGEGWDFSSAFDLVVFGNGPWSDQARRAVLGLLQAGYPPEKLHYYRAGMQGWLQLGLTTITPATDSN